MIQERWGVAARRLLPFAVLSLLLHFLLLSRWQLPIPEPPLALTLTAQLQPAPRRPPTMFKFLPKPRHRLPPAVHINAAPASTEPLPKIITAIPSAFPATIVPVPRFDDNTPSVPGANASPSVPVPPHVPAPTEALRILPQRGEIRYTLYYGDAGWIVGEALQTWDIEGTHYRLTSRAETAGVLGLFNHQHLNYESDGDVTSGGFRPMHFTVDRWRSGIHEETEADFDWNAMSVTLDTPPRTIALNPDAQDMLSFMYELGLKTLVPGRIELPITNGWKLERYQIEVEAEELIDTPLGKLKTVPLRQIVPPGTSSIELWLAPDYRMLPVRILFYGNDGRPSGEQLVSTIRVNDE